MPEISKILFILGIIFIVFGLVLWGKIPFLGRLPGDILIKREKLTFYFPLATSVLISIIITVIFLIISFFKK